MEEIKKESVLDQPREDLDTKVWKRNDNNEYSLTQEAKSKVYMLINWAIGKLGISNYGVNIIGSITSNQYTEDSDIDVHINTEEIPEEYFETANSQLRKMFEEYKEQNPEDSKIGEHPLEIYIQSNKFQDEMSVGCYDVINEKWIVGPQFKELDFDPYDEYYDEDMKYVNEIIEDIRNVILECYESALVLNNSKSEDFRNYEFKHFLDILNRGARIFDEAREFRKITSAPVDSDDAASKRLSRKWKIADSAFKLLDKFGYLPILKSMKTNAQDYNDGKIQQEQVIQSIIGTLRDNIGNGTGMSCEEVNVLESQYLQQCDEGLGKNLGMFSLIAMMVGLPGISSAKEIEKSKKNVPVQMMKASKNIDVNKDFGGLSYPRLVNLLATITYNEAMLDYRNFKDDGKHTKDDCLIAILNVIDNRSGHDNQKYVKQVSKKGGFYSTGEVRGGYDNKTYVEYFPGKDKNGNSQWYDGECWKKCVSYSIQQIKGTLKNVIGKRNMIGNKSKDNQKDWEKWGKKCDLVIGRNTRHSFGYEKSEDGSLGVKSSVYVVKKGDTLSGIAKKMGITTQEILAKNKSIKDPSKIRIGQKISV